MQRVLYYNSTLFFHFRPRRTETLPGGGQRQPELGANSLKSTFRADQTSRSQARTRHMFGRGRVLLYTLPALTSQ